MLKDPAGTYRERVLPARARYVTPPQRHSGSVSGLPGRPRMQSEAVRSSLHCSECRFGSSTIPSRRRSTSIEQRDYARAARTLGSGLPTRASSADQHARRARLPADHVQRSSVRALIRRPDGTTLPRSSSSPSPLRSFFGLSTRARLHADRRSRSAVAIAEGRPRRSPALAPAGRADPAGARLLCARRARSCSASTRHGPTWLRSRRQPQVLQGIGTTHFAPHRLRGGAASRRRWR